MTQILDEFSTKFLIDQVADILSYDPNISALELIRKLAVGERLGSEPMARKAFWLLLSRDNIEITQDRKIILTPY